MDIKALLHKVLYVSAAALLLLSACARKNDYYGRDCIRYGNILYWNNNVLYSEDMTKENALPEDIQNIGVVAAAVNQIPGRELEASSLEAGTELIYSEAKDALFVQKPFGYIEYIPMEGMEERVLRELKEEPTGVAPGYEYTGTDYVFYNGSLYQSAFQFEEGQERGNLQEAGRILHRCDDIPGEHLHSAASDAGDLVYISDLYSNDIIVLHETTQRYVAYERLEN